MTGKRKLPEGWRLASLGDDSLVTIIMGQSPPGETYNKDRIGIPFFQGCADFGSLYPEPTVWCSAPQRIAELNDILISVRAPVGPTNITKEKCCIGRGLAAIRCKEGLSYKYLLLVLRNFEKKISSGGAGSIFNAIGKDELKAIGFPLPPTLNDQLSIVNELERKMADIEKIRQAAHRQKETIATVREAFLREALPYREGEKLPEGWRWAKLGGENGITNIVNGSTPSTDVPEYWDGDILWATPSDFGNLHSIYIEDTERKITKAGLDSCSTTLLPVGTVLLTSRAPVGNLAVAKKLMCTNQGFKSFVPKESVSSLYLYFAIKNIVPEIQKISHGNTFTEITKELVSDFKIPLPPTPGDQIAIANELERKMAEVEKLRNAADWQSEAVKALPAAVLREVFEFEEQRID